MYAIRSYYATLYIAKTQHRAKSINAMMTEVIKLVELVQEGINNAEQHLIV